MSRSQPSRATRGLSPGRTYYAARTPDETAIRKAVIDNTLSNIGKPRHLHACVNVSKLRKRSRRTAAESDKQLMDAKYEAA